jgi:superfamily I DNA/RNA helicase
LYQHGYKEKIVYENVSREIWKDALLIKSADLDLPDSFFPEEYARVVQPQNVSTLSNYLKAKRVGRGTRLSKDQRKLVWKVFEEYRRLMAKNNYKEPSDAMRDARVLLETGKAKCNYSSLIVDESQDITAQGFKLIRTIVPEGPNDIFIVGDAHQRIYGHKVVMGRCGIKIIGRSRKLKLNYRTTDEVRKFAMKIFREDAIDDLDGGSDNNKGYKSIFHGPEPEIIKAEDLYDEVDKIAARISLIRKNDPEAQICVALRTKKLVENYRELLNNKDIKTTMLSADHSDDPASKAIRLGTMHRVKGLEFDHMIIAGANQGMIPLKQAIQSDEALIASENITKERCLLFVATTRAKKSLTITGYNKMSEFVTNKSE